VDNTVGEVDLRPTQRNEFGYAQPVGIGQQDRARVALAVAPSLFGGLDEALDLGRRQMLARAPIGVPA